MYGDYNKIIKALSESIGRARSRNLDKSVVKIQQNDKTTKSAPRLLTLPLLFAIITILKQRKKYHHE